MEDLDPAKTKDEKHGVIGSGIQQTSKVLFHPFGGVREKWHDPQHFGRYTDIHSDTGI